MGSENRDYLRQEARRFGGGGYGGGGVPGVSANLPPMTLWLLVINVAVFLVDSVLTGSTRGDWASPTWLGRFSAEQGILGFQAWRILTYQFLHGGFFHLLFNMIGLWIFGRLMEQWWGSKRFLAFYLLCGVGGGLLFAAVSAFPAIAFITPETPLVGASACVLGSVAGCMVKYGREPIGFMFIPITFTILMLGGVYIFLDVLEVLAGGRSAGSAVAHLGGAGVGYLLIQKPKWLDWADRVSPSAIQSSINEGRYEKKRQAEAATEAEVDRILAKVAEKGLQSLTRKEKKTLNQATESKQAG
ncbi:MAG: rhomboid family intramembrane serine protease [Planctomycetota bacterium]